MITIIKLREHSAVSISSGVVKSNNTFGQCATCVEFNIEEEKL